MDFALSEEQEMLSKSARGFLGTECPKPLVRQLEASEPGYSPELWHKMADLGWMGLALPEEYGGAGLGIMELAVLFEEFGRAAVPGPMFSTTVLGSLPVLDWGSAGQKSRLLPKAASGDLILTMATAEPEAIHEQKLISTRATPQDGGYVRQAH